MFWPWKHWESSLASVEEGKESAQSIFIKETFQRLLRLSYREYVSFKVPAFFHKFFPEEEKPDYKFEYNEEAQAKEEGSEAKEGGEDPEQQKKTLLAYEIEKMVLLKEDESKMLLWIENDEQYNLLPPNERVEIFTTCMLWNGIRVRKKKGV